MSLCKQLRVSPMEEQFLDNWSTQIRKGVLELCILNAIRGGRVYGYDIVRRLRDLDGLVISEGTIYPILSRFKRDGLVSTTIEESTQGPARKYYVLADRGRNLLETMNAHWSAIRRGIDSLAFEQGESKPCPPSQPVSQEEVKP